MLCVYLSRCSTEVDGTCPSVLIVKHRSGQSICTCDHRQTINRCGSRAPHLSSASVRSQYGEGGPLCNAMAWNTQLPEPSGLCQQSKLPPLTRASAARVVASKMEFEDIELQVGFRLLLAGPCSLLGPAAARLGPAAGRAAMDGRTTRPAAGTATTRY